MEVMILLTEILAVIAAFTLVVVGLVSASWSVLLVLLLVVLIGTRWFTSQIFLQNPLPGTETSSPSTNRHLENLKMMYRGISYGKSSESSSSGKEISEKEVIGKYRGHPWKNSPQASVSLDSSKIELKYRGAKITHTQQS